jgi:hypothetical protein
MFTWVCPECGAEVDVSEKSCPRCHSEFAAASTEDTADKLPRLKETPDPASAGPSFALKPTHVAIFVVALIVAIGGAFYASQPARLVLEDIPDDAIAEIEETGGSGIAGPVEVTGLRFRYDEEYRPLARALIINHSNLELYGVELNVSLNTADAPPDASPLATFEVILDEPLGAQQSVEMETEMLVAATIQALPSTDRLRVEVERLQ